MINLNRLLYQFIGVRALALYRFLYAEIAPLDAEYLSHLGYKSARIFAAVKRLQLIGELPALVLFMRAFIAT